MFISTWNKYLPVIKILLKRSVNAEQKLDMNESDFQRATGGKKVKFTFSIALIKGRPNGVEPFPSSAKDLIAVLQEDDTTNKFIRQNELEFTMNGDFQLLIKNNPISEDQVKQNDETAEKAYPGKTSVAEE